MDENGLKLLAREIVRNARDLKDARTSEKSAPVNYACVFCQSEDQFESLKSVAAKLGRIAQETPAGPVFRIEPLDTAAGKLELLKIRKPDAQHPELGDADFTVGNYAEFKEKHLREPGFKLLRKEKFEMLELQGEGVRAYFSHPTLAEVLGLS